MDATILDHLIRVVAEHGQAALWLDAIPWIGDSCGAIGVRSIIDLAARIQHQYGEIDDEKAEAIDRWEESLLSMEDWVPPGADSLSSSHPASSTLIDDDLSLVHIPLMRSGSVIGGVSLAFADGSLPPMGVVSMVSALVQTINRVGALAAERYEIQRRLTHINLLNEVSRAITSTLDINAVLEYTTALAANTLGADASSLLLIDQESDELVFTIPHGESGGVLREFRMPITEGVAGWAARYGQPVIVNDTSKDPRFTTRVDSHSGFVTRNILCVPLQVKGNTIGVLEVLNKLDGDNFSDEDLDWLTTLAAQSAIAIENARLFSSLREERDRIIKADFQVRHQLARDLHDGAAQLLGAIIMNLEVMRRLAKTNPAALEQEFDGLRELAVRANQEVRQLLFELRPLILESRGLLDALRAMVAQQKKLGIIIELQSERLPAFANKDVEGTVFMIIQEAVNNVRKHARASQIQLRLRLEQDSLVVDVEDNGVGFDLAATEASYSERGSLGLLSMRERAERLDGNLRIISPRPGVENGTAVVLRVPLSRLMSTENMPGPA